ncbi:hypothetical protein BGX38DRAFT_1143215 [Terfezia claveryi]|nr:hypothetical protein BGX38DRAFT_1143215 [Terfezia claveryi]
MLRTPGYMLLRCELHMGLGHILDFSISEIIHNVDLDHRQRIDAGDMQTLCFDKLISENDANLEYLGAPLLAQSSRQQSPLSSSGDLDPSTMSEDNQCPICYENITAKGFTQCEHKVCPPCLEKLVAATTTSGVSCPLCRQGNPKNVDKDEISRRLEDLFQQGAHTYHREIPLGPWVGQTQPQHVNYATPPPEAPVRNFRQVHYYPSAAHRLSRSRDSQLERHTDSVSDIFRRVLVLSKSILTLVSLQYCHAGSKFQRNN